MKYSESKIEREVVKYAKNKGWITYKLSPFNAIGAPDRLFIYDNLMFFIEFKSKKGNMSFKQSINKKKLIKLNHNVYICSSISYGKNLIDMFINGVKNANI